jgi:hypothetical protein
MDTFCLDRLAATKALILVYDEAITKLVSGAVHSYTLDTGQSRQVVTRFDIASMQKILTSLENKVVTLEARCNRAYRTYGRPIW